MHEQNKVEERQQQTEEDLGKDREALTEEERRRKTDKGNRRREGS